MAPFSAGTSPLPRRAPRLPERPYAKGLAALLLVAAAGCRASSPEADSESTGSTSQSLTQAATYRRGVSGTVSDASIASSALKKNFGDDTKLRVSAKNEALLRFDLSAVPANAVIESATLGLYLGGGDDEADDDGQDGDKHGFPVVPIYVHRALAPWTEATVTYASFAQRFDTTAAAIILPTSSNVLKSVDVKSLVQGWVSRALPNDGLLLRTEAKRHTIFASSESRTASLRPSLALSYTTPDDHCAARPCLNGATCNNGATSFTCACATGYTGTRCETAVDACAGAPCHNGGACVVGTSSFSCTCPNGFTGPTCDTNIDDCAGSPCQNGGVCTDGVHSFTCACPAGYTGSRCETRIDRCAQSPCANGGTCTSTAESYVCACPVGFSGATCEINTDDCASNPCSNGGTCNDGIASFTCTCAPGYTGATCATLIDNCASVPCQNGGTCTNGVNAYSCACAPGFTGTHCETDINDCAAGPCQNGGLCVDGVNAFTCQCQPTFTGDACQTPVPTDPCLANGGTYSTRVGDYTINSATSLSALRCVSEVTGTLYVDVDATTPVVDLPSLHRVGALRVTAASQATTLALGGLSAVGGIVLIADNATLVDVSAAGLAQLGDLYVANNAALQRFAAGGFPSAGSVTLRSNPLLADLGPIGLGRLASVQSDLIVNDNPRLPSLGPNGLSALVSVGGNLDVRRSPVLTSLGPSTLSSLTSVTGALIIQAEPQFTSIDASHASLGGVYFDDNAQLRSLHLGPLPAQLSVVFISGSPLLTDLGPTAFAGVQRVTSDVGIMSTGLTSIGPNGFSDLVYVAGRFDILGNPALASLGPTSLSSLTFVGGVFDIQNDPLLTTIDLSHASVGGLYLAGNTELRSLRLGPLPAELSFAFIAGSPLLTDLGPTAFAGVQRVTNDVGITGTGLASVGPSGFSNLLSVGGRFDITANPALTSLGPTSLASLTSVASFFVVQSDPLLTSIDVSHASLGGVYLSGNAQLRSLRLGPLPAELSYALITGSPLLTDLGPTAFAGVRRVTNDVGIGDTGLATVGPNGFSDLISVAGRFDVVNNPFLTSLGPTGLNSLTTLGAFEVATNARLAAIDAPALATIGSFLVVDGNAALTRISLGALTHLGGPLQITNNPGVASCFTDLRGQLVGYSGAVSISGNGLACP